MEILIEEAKDLLKRLISIQSFSKEEAETADVLYDFLKEKSVKVNRIKNNIWAVNKYYDAEKPTILLNSHHDTVKPNAGYTNDPYLPIEKDGKLYGLGSNDAGGCLVSLLATFLHFYSEKGLKYNLLFAGTAEEEISGQNGIALAKKEFGEIDFAIVGEPTLMDAAIAEKGLIVIDAEAKGVAGHAAREEGDNAIYKAIDDIAWIRDYTFPKKSEQLGEMKMTVSLVNAGTQHNVVPDRCSFVIDVRVTDVYDNQEIVDIINENTKSEITPRSLRLTSSSIPLDHPFVAACVKDGAKPYGSPTMSDQALLDVPSIKMGPGDSARSHSPDEFIYLKEIDEGIEKYIKRLKTIL